MGKVLKIAAILVAAIGILIGGLLMVVDVDQFRPTIQSRLESTLHRNVSLGKMHLKLLPLAIRIDQVAISEDPAFRANSSFLTAKEIDVSVELLPLLRKEVRVDSIRIVEPVVELIKNRDGRWNFSTFTEGGKASTGGGSADFALAELILDDGRIGLTDLQASKPRVEYEDIDLTLRDLAPGKPFSAELTMGFPDKLEAKASLHGTYDMAAAKLQIANLGLKIGAMNLSGSGTVITVPAHMDVQIKTDGSITELARVAAAFGTAFSSDMKVTGDLNAQVHIQGPADALQYSGEVSLAKVEVNRQGWKQPVRVSDMRIQLTPQELHSNTFAVESGGTKLNASFAAQDYAREPRLRAEVMTKGASLGEVIKMAQTYGVSAADGIDASGTISLDVKVTGSPKDLDYSGTGSLENASLQMPTLAKPLLVKNANLRFDDGHAVLENMQASLGGSTLRGSAKVRNFAAPEIEFNADVDQLNVAELQAITKNPPVAVSAEPKKGASKIPPERTILKMRGKGTLGVGKIQYNTLALSKVRSECTLDKGVLRLEPLTAELFGGLHRGAISVDMRPENSAFAVQSKFEKVNANELVSATTNLKNLLFGMMAADTSMSFAPKPNEDFAKSLNGTINLRLNDGKLAGVSLVNELSKVGKALGFAQKSELATNILSLTGLLKIDNGVASTNDLKLAFDGGSLSAAGTVGLVDNAIKMKVTSVLSRAVSDQFGGGQVGGYLTTALSNQKGELVIPCLVTGTTAKPIFVPDAAEFARLKMQNLLPGAGNPAGLAKGVLGAIERGQKGGAKGVGGTLFDMLGGRKKPEEKK